MTSPPKPSDDAEPPTASPRRRHLLRALFPGLTDEGAHKLWLRVLDFAVKAVAFILLMSLALCMHSVLN